MRRLGEIRGHIMQMFASRSMEKDEFPGGFAIPKRNQASPRGDLQFPNGNGLVPGGICNSQTEMG